MNKHFPSTNGQTTFGMHLMLDAYEVDSAKLDDMKLIFRFLNELPDVIGMKKISTPLVVDADATANNFDPGGISGFVMIAESHISIHTFADKGFFTMDVYSCTNFEDQIDALLDFVKQTFPYQKEELQIVKRGTKYPFD